MAFPAISTVPGWKCDISGVRRWEELPQAARDYVEYIEKAIKFYSGYLDTQNASAYLPRILSDILEGKLGALGSRIGRLLFKLAVEQNMTANILASEINVGLDTMEKVRSRCVREVKQINGEIKFEDALKYQKGWD